MSAIDEVCSTSPEGAPGAKGSGRGLALVADDNRGIRTLLVAALRQQGLEVIAARDGDEAASSLEGLDHAPAVCVLDVHMPGRDGLAVSELARTRFPDTRIVLVSGHPEPSGPAADERPYDIYLGKPFLLEDLLHAAGLASARTGR